RGGWRGVPAGRGQGRSGQCSGLVTECLQQGRVTLVGAGNLAEMRVIMLGGPVIERVRAVTSPKDGGQAAPAAVNHVTLGGEGERGEAQGRLGGRLEQIERRIAAVLEGPDP